MKIDLEYPYSADWRYGYIQKNSEDRNNVILYNSDQDRSTVSYARYLMCVYLGRYLDSSEHVDHKNEDKTDDRINNLQILTLKQNNQKYALTKGKILVDIICPLCNNVFTKRKGLTQMVESLKGKVSCCSRKCSNKFRKLNISEDEKQKISEETVLNCYRQFK